MIEYNLTVDQFVRLSNIIYRNCDNPPINIDEYLKKFNGSYQSSNFRDNKMGTVFFKKEKHLTLFLLAIS